jgi:hypothetical protein
VEKKKKIVYLLKWIAYEIIIISSISLPAATNIIKNIQKASALTKEKWEKYI